MSVVPIDDVKIQPNFSQACKTGSTRNIAHNLDAGSQNANHEEEKANLQHDGVLCTECASLDMASIVSELDMDSVKFIFRLRTEHLESNRLSCPLCSIIIWMLQGVPKSKPRGRLALYICSTLWLDPNVQFGRYAFWLDWIKEKNANFLILANGRYDLPCRRLALIWNTLSPSPVMTDQTTQSRKLQPLNVRRFIDYAYLKQWLKRCDTLPTHREFCNPPVVRPYWPAKVIDCHRLTIVPTQSSYDYVALSYVWGLQPHKPPSKYPLLRLQDLPPTIRDAIKITIETGHRYLWVDRYCINQDQNTAKNIDIQNMGQIYNGASLTIIATAGSDPNYGLPGVSKPRDGILPFVTSSEWAISGVPEDVQYLIYESVWVTRAWTYQEALLSRRRLFFTDQALYFECHKAGCCLEFGDGVEAPEGDTVSIFGASGYDTSKIFGYISDYSRRQLTYDTDYLNGLLGILGFMAGVENPALHLFGVPICPQMTLPIQSTLKRTNTRDCREFMIGMGWTVAKSKRRNIDAPSWSWVAWKGSVSWPAEFDHGRAYFITNSEVWIEDATQAVLPIQTLREHPDTWKEDYRLCKVIHINAEVFGIALVYPDIHKWETYGFRKWNKVTEPKSITADYFAVWETHNDILVHAPVFLFQQESFEPPKEIHPLDKNFKVLKLGTYDYPEKPAPGFSSGVEGKILREVRGGYEVLGYISFNYNNMHFFARQGTSKNVTEKMLLPDMIKERVRLL
ncbi:HET-domain-containing protein [Jackrogersella minutella]|nr:HET-domain-containing protein [Jackrogersella minutella]